MTLDSREKDIKKVTLAGFFVNVLLTAGKVFAGFLGGSSAMIADGLHSLSDLFSDVVVLLFAGIFSKGKDRGHAFGHGKFETLATLIVSIVLIAAGVGLLKSGVESVVEVLKGGTLPVPGKIALVAAFVSVVAKEILYRVTVKEGRRINSPVVMANAWHHRSDALSSVGAFAGIGGAMLLGDKWAVLDPIASCMISVVIVFVAVKMAVPCFADLLESSLPEDVEAEIEAEMWRVDGVRDVHDLKTRRNGISFVIDVHVVVDPHMTIVEAHNIATNVERRLRDKYGDQTQISIHMEPDKASE